MTNKKTDNSNAINRRNFLKLGAAGAAIGAVTLPAKAKESVVKKIDEKTAGNFIKTHDDFPHEVRDDYKPHSNKDIMFTAGWWGTHPEATDVHESAKKFAEKTFMHFEEKKGFDQLSKSLNAGAWALHNKVSPMSSQAISGEGILKWDQYKKKEGEFLPHHDWVNSHQYKFSSKKTASDTIKRAARLYGASLVGITKRDKRWDYADFVDPHAIMEGRPEDAIYGWERFPFEPKSVIVMAFEMDYEAIATAPSDVEGAGAGTKYSEMTKVAYQLAIFLKQLGYQAVPCGNDTGLSIPYAIAAGLGEGSRMGNLITYKYGPRVRLAKVYTDFDFVEYDKPIEFGAMDFCKNCMRCADACPGKAISFEKEPTFEPAYDGAWYNAKGVKKYYMDAKKCFHTWSEFGTDCGSCMASCPYNKPDFWHHRLVDKITAAMPGPVHNFMREMDILFGYGDVGNPEKIDVFYNPEGRSYNGH
ncbi:reductive dehalogenase [Ancylomarina longa]|uniref:Reductive dehalogenase n=1 Tax=Ancylomarina longa TaxID=2487017 RepID=A0A434B0A3_9BACT|nr:reductive dehalogenase [Ancylomarina longa]RUT80185.1 reductive dehalogenase [Ancylomarina longa]